MKITVYLTRAQIRVLIGALRMGDRGYWVARRKALDELQQALSAADAIRDFRLTKRHGLAWQHKG